MNWPALSLCVSPSVLVSTFNQNQNPGNSSNKIRRDRNLAVEEEEHSIRPLIRDGRNLTSSPNLLNQLKLRQEGTMVKWTKTSRHSCVLTNQINFPTLIQFIDIFVTNQPHQENGSQSRLRKRRRRRTIHLNSHTYTNKLDKFNKTRIITNHHQEIWTKLWTFHSPELEINGRAKLCSALGENALFNIPRVIIR